MIFILELYDPLIVKEQFLFLACFLVELLSKVKLLSCMASLNNDNPSPWKKKQVERHVSSHVLQKQNYPAGYTLFCNSDNQLSRKLISWTQSRPRISWLRAQTLVYCATEGGDVFIARFVNNYIYVGTLQPIKVPLRLKHSARQFT